MCQIAYTKWTFKPFVKAVNHLEYVARSGKSDWLEAIFIFLVYCNTTLMEKWMVPDIVLWEGLLEDTPPKLCLCWEMTLELSGKLLLTKWMKFLFRMRLAFNFHGMPIMGLIWMRFDLCNDLRWLADGLISAWFLPSRVDSLKPKVWKT